MRKVLRFAGQAVVIAAITLALDFTLTNLMFPGLKRALSVPNEANDNAYLPAPYDHWRDWAAARYVRFIDGFAPFFREPADTVLRKYYIAGDVHFSELGNRLLHDTVKRALSADGGDARSAEGARRSPIERTTTP